MIRCLRACAQLHGGLVRPRFRTNSVRAASASLGALALARLALGGRIWRRAGPSAGARVQGRSCEAGAGSAAARLASRNELTDATRGYEEGVHLEKAAACVQR